MQLAENRSSQSAHSMDVQQQVGLTAKSLRVTRNVEHAGETMDVSRNVQQKDVAMQQM